ncbi:MAG: hypothetical protein K2I70_03625, partial [Bacilli bacterium]|nr:hypothetical protein [Bacilli bacterium]
ISYANNMPNDAVFLYLILNLDLSVSKIDEVINGASFGNDGFLHKKTVYKMSEYDDKKVIS